MTERQIFTLAVEINDPARLEAFLSQACGADQELRARIDELLAAHNAPDSQFLKTPVVDQLQESTDPGVEKTIQLPPKEEPDEEELPGQPDLSHIQPSSKPGSIGTLGHYEILSILGHGAFGIVFKAFDEKLHRHVAIKMMSAQIAATSPARKRFLREARAAAAIRHDNVTQVYSVEEEPVPYLVMEFIDGQTLQSKQRKQGPLEVAELLHIGRQIAAGLAAAHEKSLIHRDVKPGNILLEQGAEQKVKITDFGLARAADDASLTRSGMISGTPLYMAPEQALGGTLDGRSDLFSLGSVLYELATGRPPFRAPTTVAVLRRVVDDTPRPMREIIPELPEWFVTIVNRLLEKNPDQRFQSAKEVADLLAKCQAELQLNGEVTCVSGTSPRSGSRETSAAPAASGKGLTTSAAPPNAKKPPLKTVLYALFLGLLVISPILFGKHLSRLTSSWFFGSIPTLPTVERAAGLRFDGENDFVQVPVTWDLPQFTIEAFVTPAEAGPHRTVVELTNYGSGTKDERLELFDAVGGKGERLSHAHVMGRSGSLSAFGPQTPGVREHRAIVCDGQEIHYYINGVWQGKRKNQPQDNQLWRMRWLTIGCQLGEKNFFKGDIDQLRISKVARYVDNFPPVTLVESDDATLALYNFEEGQGDLLKDLSGNGLDAKISGATWIHPAQGLQFDGVDDYVEIPGLSWNSNQYTIEAYISQDGGHGNLFQAAGAGGMLHMYLYPKGGGAGISRDQVYTNANGPRKGKSRQHLAVVYDGKNLNYFVQGQLAGVKTNVSTAATPMPLDRMMIGSKLQSDPSKPEFFEGRVERLRVSNNVRYVLPFQPGELKTDDATLALYDFTTGQGDTVKDVSGRSPDGKIVGATWVNRSGIHQNSDDPGEDGRSLTTSATGAPPLAVAPFNVEQAKQHQTAWAKHLDIPPEFTDKHGMKFVLIPPGEFQMGFSQAELDTLTRELKQAGAGEYDLFSASTSGPQHPVRITKPFYMSAHEVTVAQYRKFIDETHYMTTAEQLGGQRKKWSEYLAPENPDPHPVLGVSWTDTEAYCKHRSAQEGVTYRLPSEAEWEYACRAGTTTLWSFGVNPAQIGEYAVTAPEGTSTQPVGSRKPNSFGMFDMYGNAEEWCLDWHIQDFYATSPTDDPVNLATPADTNSGRVARGGGTVSLPWQLRSSTRRWDFPSTPVNLKGFRVVISGDLKKAVPPQTGWHGWPADAPKPAIAPFNSEQAKKHQEEWAAYLKVPVEYTNSIGMKFRLIPPGEFLMGAPQEEIDELAASNDPQNKAWEDVIRSQGPQHRVVLTQPFYVGVHEVTQGQYQRVMGTGPATPPEGSGSDLANHPEKGAVWGDAVSFTIQLSELEKLPASYLGTGLHWVPRDGTGYCLPSESQWEFAARAGTTTRYWSGSTKSDLLAVDWVAENSENRTHAVGERPANPFGLFDVHGNAMEWTESQFDPAEYAKYQSIPVIDPPRRLKSDWHAYVARGGANDSWGVLSISSAFRMGRSFGNPSIAPDSGGFRVVLSVDAVKEMLRTEADTSGKKASQDSPHAGNPLAPTTIWSAPVNLGSAINTPAREANPSLTSDELLLVFTRGEELFEARRASRDEPFAPATKLAGPLPSAKFLTGCLSGDGLQLVFSAIPPGGNAQDVLIATRTSRDEPFGQPVALPQSINAPGEDRHPVLSPDGLILALTSVRGGQQTGGLLLFTRPNPTAEFNPTPTVDARLQGSWSVINSFSSDGRGLLKTTMADNVETITWHTRTADSPDWSEGQPLPAPFDAIKFGAPFLSTDGNTIYFHSRYVPDGQGDLDLWVSRRTMKTP